MFRGSIVMAQICLFGRTPPATEDSEAPTTSRFGWSVPSLRVLGTVHTLSTSRYLGLWQDAIAVIVTGKPGLIRRRVIILKTTDQWYYASISTPRCNHRWRIHLSVLPPFYHTHPSFDSIGWHHHGLGKPLTSIHHTTTPPHYPPSPPIIPYTFPKQNSPGYNTCSRRNANTSIQVPMGLKKTTKAKGTGLSAGPRVLHLRPNLVEGLIYQDHMGGRLAPFRPKAFRKKNGSCRKGKYGSWGKYSGCLLSEGHFSSFRWWGVEMDRRGGMVSCLCGVGSEAHEYGTALKFVLLVHTILSLWTGNARFFVLEHLGSGSDTLQITNSARAMGSFGRLSCAATGTYDLTGMPVETNDWRRNQIVETPSSLA
ncbi:hypothetical protein HOY82DRAFT_638761 [Tuber indicum]|nr:hypothetical protein HOY82DRAFT_638761 [Tuber indicum]